MAFALYGQALKARLNVLAQRNRILGESRKRAGFQRTDHDQYEDRLRQAPLRLGKTYRRQYYPQYPKAQANVWAFSCSQNTQVTFLMRPARRCVYAADICAFPSPSRTATLVST